MAAKPSTSGLVNCVLTSDGTEVPSSIEIVSVATYKDINRIPYATISIVDGNVADQSFDGIENDLLKPGKELEIKAGFDSDSSTIFKGIITQVGLKVTSKNSLLTVNCKDKSVKATADKKTKIFTEVKDSDIYSTIASDAGLSVDSDTTTFQHEQIVQYNATDWDFILLRAEANGQVVIADDGSLSIKKPSFSGSESLTLEFGTNIISFETSLNSEKQLAEVEVKSWDTGSMDALSSSGSSDAMDVGEISNSDLANIVSKKYSVNHGGLVSEDELKAWGDSIDLYHKMSKIQGVFTCFGTSDVSPGDIIEIKGASNRFSGKHYVTGVSHEIIGGGWKTKVQIGFPSEMFHEKFRFQPQGASGLMPAMNGLMCGKVTKIADDPNGEYRIQVQVPVLGDDVNLWARYTVPDGGSSRGLVYYPEVDDEVVMGFLNNDPRYPVILGSLFSGTNTPPAEPEATNAEKGFYSKKELKLLFNDEDETITIETAGGNTITVDNKGSSIDITDASGNEVKLSSSGVDISSASNLNIQATGNIDINASGNLTLGGVNVEAAAQANFKASGNAGANLETSAIAVVKGSLVQIN